MSTLASGTPPACLTRLPARAPAVLGDAAARVKAFKQPKKEELDPPQVMLPSYSFSYLPTL